MGFIIEYYEDSSRFHPDTTTTAETDREARREAANMLGHKNLRGASSWEHHQGGIVYQFGPRDEDNEYPFAVIISEEEEYFPY